MKKIIKKFFLIFGIISFVIVLISLGLYYFFHRSNQISYDKMDLNDGPYIFWTNDTTLKILDIQFIPQNKDFNIGESKLNLKDTTLVLNKIKNELNIEFNPYQEHMPDTSIFVADRICAVSDIHGCFNYFVARLQNNHIIDDSLNWNWETGHLVIVGDVLDKGPNVTQCLWFIKKLEKQAETAGGKVHYLLGNHEIGILKGRLHRIHKKYELIMEKLDLDNSGYSIASFDYTKLFGQDTEFGKWLGTKNGVIKINNVLFSHACISTYLKKEQLEINDINNYTRKLLKLKHYYAADKDEREIFRRLKGFWGPYWCDEYFSLKYIKWEKKNFSNRLTEILDYYNSDTIIMGHQHIKKITPLYDNKVILIGVSVPYIPENDILKDNSDPQMLLIENDNIYILHFDGTKEIITKDM